MPVVAAMFFDLREIKRNTSKYIMALTRYNQKILLILSSGSLSNQHTLILIAWKSCLLLKIGITLKLSSSKCLASTNLMTISI